MTMTTETIAIYATRTGKEAMRIDKMECSRGTFYSYIGKYGAASGLDYKAMQKEVASMKGYHKGMVLAQGTEI
jgi:hypothetical protein